MEDIVLPVLVSPKLDGIRCVIVGGRPLTRKLKAFPNAYVNDILKGLPPLDGELIVGSPVDELAWNNSQSGVMSQDGTPDFKFHVFDRLDRIDRPFSERYASLVEVVQAIPESIRPFIKIVPHTRADTLEDLVSFEQSFTAQGYEGMMVRSLDGPYKYGRSTVPEGYLLKVKRIQTAEVRIRGYKERMHNTNPQKRNAVGRAERSSAKAGKVGMDTLGALICEAPLSALAMPGKSYDVPLDTLIQFDVGTGLDDRERQELWDARGTHDDELVQISFQGLTTKLKPRFPRWRGFRDKRDACRSVHAQRS